MGLVNAYTGSGANQPIENANTPVYYTHNGVTTQVGGTPTPINGKTVPYSGTYYANNNASQPVRVNTTSSPSTTTPPPQPAKTTSNQGTIQQAPAKPATAPNPPPSMELILSPEMGARLSVLDSSYQFSPDYNTRVQSIFIPKSTSQAAVDYITTGKVDAGFTLPGNAPTTSNSPFLPVTSLGKGQSMVGYGVSTTTSAGPGITKTIANPAAPGAKGSTTYSISNPSLVYELRVLQGQPAFQAGDIKTVATTPLTINGTLPGQGVPFLSGDRTIYGLGNQFTYPTTVSQAVFEATLAAKGNYIPASPLQTDSQVTALRSQQAQAANSDIVQSTITGLGILGLFPTTFTEAPSPGDFIVNAGKGVVSGAVLLAPAMLALGAQIATGHILGPGGAAYNLGAGEAALFTTPAVAAYEAVTGNPASPAPYNAAVQYAVVFGGLVGSYGAERAATSFNLKAPQEVTDVFERGARTVGDIGRDYVVLPARTVGDFLGRSSVVNAFLPETPLGDVGIVRAGGSVAGAVVESIKPTIPPEAALEFRVRFNAATAAATGAVSTLTTGVSSTVTPIITPLAGTAANVLSFTALRAEGAADLVGTLGGRVDFNAAYIGLRSGIGQSGVIGAFSEIGEEGVQGGQNFFRDVFGKTPSFRTDYTAYAPERPTMSVGEYSAPEKLTSVSDYVRPSKATSVEDYVRQPSSTVRMFSSKVVTSLTGLKLREIGQNLGGTDVDYALEVTPKLKTQIVPASQAFPSSSPVTFAQLTGEVTAEPFNFASKLATGTGKISVSSTSVTYVGVIEDIAKDTTTRFVVGEGSELNIEPKTSINSFVTTISEGRGQPLFTRSLRATVVDIEEPVVQPSAPPAGAPANPRFALGKIPREYTPIEVTSEPSAGGTAVKGIKLFDNGGMQQLVTDVGKATGTTQQIRVSGLPAPRLVTAGPSEAGGATIYDTLAVVAGGSRYLSYTPGVAVLPAVRSSSRSSGRSVVVATSVAELVGNAQALKLVGNAQALKFNVAAGPSGLGKSTLRVVSGVEERFKVGFGVDVGNVTGQKFKFASATARASATSQAQETATTTTTTTFGSPFNFSNPIISPYTYTDVVPIPSRKGGFPGRRLRLRLSPPSSPSGSASAGS